MERRGVERGGEERAAEEHKVTLSKESYNSVAKSSWRRLSPHGGLLCIVPFVLGRDLLAVCLPHPHPPPGV